MSCRPCSAFFSLCYLSHFLPPVWLLLSFCSISHQLPNLSFSAWAFLQAFEGFFSASRSFLSFFSFLSFSSLLAGWPLPSFRPFLPLESFLLLHRSCWRIWTGHLSAGGFCLAFFQTTNPPIPCQSWLLPKLSGKP